MIEPMAPQCSSRSKPALRSDWRCSETAGRLRFLKLCEISVALSARFLESARICRRTGFARIEKTSTVGIAEAIMPSVSDFFDMSSFRDAFSRAIRGDRSDNGQVPAQICVLAAHEAYPDKSSGRRQPLVRDRSLGLWPLQARPTLGRTWKTGDQSACRYGNNPRACFALRTRSTPIDIAAVRLETPCRLARSTTCLHERSSARSSFSMTSSFDQKYC